MGRHITPVVTETMKPNWRARQFEIHGGKCRYCGTTENVEIHHIIPKNQGGDNRDSNIVLLCRECHAKAHRKAQYVYEYRAGRKKIENPENLDEIIDKYLDRKLGLQNALEILGVGKNTFYKWIEEYRERTGDARTHRDAFLGNDHGLTRQEYMRAYAKKG